jgi:hypothetical protein
VDVSSGGLPAAYRCAYSRCRGQLANLESARADAVKVIGHQAYLAGVADDDPHAMGLGLVIDNFEGHR